MTNEEREALENIAGYAETARRHTEDAHILSFLGEIEGWARSALSKPPRNCDVGTAEEQAKRFDRFCAMRGCRIGGDATSKCPFDPDACEFAWAQMPYQKEDDNGDSDE